MPTAPNHSITAAVDLISRTEANQILSDRYPSDEELNRFPLGDLLKAIPAADPRYGQQPNGDAGHIARVIEGVNILLSPHPERVVKQWAHSKPFQDTILYESAFKKIFAGNSGKQGSICKFETIEEKNSFFRILALYHDIGKAIITERHPIVGWHLVNDVHRQRVERTLYPFILGKDTATWQQQLDAHGGNVERIASSKELRLLNIFHSVIRYHDYFGILGTGEGALPIMVDLIELRGTDPQDAQELFAVLMIFTLADVFGSVNEILPQKVDVFCRDWEMLCEMIAAPEVRGDRRAFYHKLLEKSQTADSTIERLWRLMYEAAPEDWRNDVIPGKVEKVFKEATLSRMYPFIKNFALFCKMDYCLNFKITLMNLAQEKANAKELNDGVSVAINAMITLLAELEKRYGDLCC